MKIPLASDSLKQIHRNDRFRDSDRVWSTGKFAQASERHKYLIARLAPAKRGQHHVSQASDINQLEPNPRGLEWRPQ